MLSESNKKLLVVDNLTIHYTEKGEGENGIVFLHGNSLNASFFKHQLDELFHENFKNIAFDLPGHGNSEFSKHPEKHYNIPFYSKVLKELCDKLQLKQVVLVGHSLGGHIALQSIPLLNKLVKGVLIFGTPPLTLPLDFSQAFLPNPNIGLVYKGLLTKSEADLLSADFTLNQEANQLVSSSILNTDGNAREFFAKSIALNQLSDEIEILKESRVVTAIIHGQKDPFVNINYLRSLKNINLYNSIEVFDKSGHSPFIEDATKFNSFLKEFVINTITKK